MPQNRIYCNVGSGFSYLVLKLGHEQGQVQTSYTSIRPLPWRSTAVRVGRANDTLTLEFIGICMSHFLPTKWQKCWFVLRGPQLHTSMIT